MSLKHDGLVKLSEETSELIMELAEFIKQLATLEQTAAKKTAYFDTDEHPDGRGNLKERLENEMADVAAIMLYIKLKFQLDEDRMSRRMNEKIKLYQQWHNKP